MTRERYRRLPGRRRGILGGASVWLGSDHLLAVRSLRFRENYKRFFLRDVQAIAVARHPRFHISMHGLVLAWTLLWTYVILRSLWDWADVAFWSLAFCLAAAWLVISLAFSCTCRLYTAVSREELPSIYRTWTARRFLAKVEPLIAQAQGTLEGDWTEALESKGVGPAPPLPPPAEPPETVRTTLIGPQPEIAAVEPNKTVPAFFIATLLMDAGVSAATIHSESVAAFWIHMGLMLVRLLAATLIFIERQRRRVRAGLQTLAIVSIVATGILFYIQQMNTQLGEAGVPNSLAILTQIDIGVSLVLAAIGFVMILRSGS